MICVTKLFWQHVSKLDGANKTANICFKNFQSVLGFIIRFWGIVTAPQTTLLEDPFVMDQKKGGGKSTLFEFKSYTQ